MYVNNISCLKIKLRQLFGILDGPQFVVRAAHLLFFAQLQFIALYIV